MSEVSITALGALGDGVAERDGTRLHVPFTLPGERVRLSAEGERGAIAAVLEASPERVTPFCPHFGICGGCQLQHMALPAQQAFKRELVVRALGREGLDVPVQPTIATTGGRQRATIHVRNGRAGYMRARSHEVEDIDSCPILVPSLSGVGRMARAFAGVVGDCEVYFAQGDGLDIAIRAKRRGKPQALIAVAQRVPGLVRLAFNGEVVYQTAEPGYGIGTARVPLPVESFLQPSREGETVLAGLVMAATADAKRVADLFCGIGTFALRLAERVPVMAVDGDRPAIAALEKAVRHTRGLKAITPIKRDLFREPLVAVELKGIDTVVFDPPRAGAEAQARELARSPLKTIVGVSCDPVSFARDAAILTAGGYRLEAVTPVDQFAHSAHVELVGVFRR
jgi:23S rRNA (uracil1939-C5)-methyltransferase